MQDLQIGRAALYHAIAELAAQRWNSRGNCMLVVGATYPRELAEIREIVGDMPFLVPGVGAQGGDVAQAVLNGRTRSGTGLIISSSRAILYASSGDRTSPQAARARPTTLLRDQINASSPRRMTRARDSRAIRASARGRALYCRAARGNPAAPPPVARRRCGQYAAARQRPRAGFTRSAAGALERIAERCCAICARG